MRFLNGLYYCSVGFLLLLGFADLAHGYDEDLPLALWFAILIVVTLLKLFGEVIIPRR